LTPFRSPIVLACLVLAVLAGGVITYRPPGNTAVAPGAPDPSASAPAPSPAREPSESARREENVYDGGVGFVVPYRPDCPPESQRRGDEPPVGFKEWCERVGPDQGLKHGKLISWDKAGRKLGEQQFRNGTAHKPNGKPTK
jgi:hypothetical protein